MSLPVYEELNDILRLLDFGERASELHGFLCGVVAFDIAYPLDSSITTLAPDLRQDVINEQLAQTLDSLYETVRQQMTDPVLQLELLIPEENSVNLSTRVKALACWCDGFLFGLANAGLRERSDLPEDTSEILLDLTRISQLQGADTGDEDEESSFNELLEYVRMSALLVAEELQPIKMSTELQ